MPADIFAYPGQYVYWQILWAQIVLLVFIQFTTALSLYDQKAGYANFITRPLEKLLPWKGRDLLIKIHAASGISIFVLNILCTSTWFYYRITGGATIESLLFGTSDVTLMAWVNILLTTSITLMFVFGVSLYKNNRPDTSLPFWKFEYFLSRLIHRLAFFFIIVVAGYHLFLLPMIYRIWPEWIFNGYLFSILLLAAFVIGGLSSAQAVLMIIELLLEKSMVREDRSPIPLILPPMLLIVAAYALLAYLFQPPSPVIFGISLFLISAILSSFAKFAIPRLKQKPPVIVSRRVYEEEVLPLVSKTLRNYLRDTSRDKLLTPVLAVIDYTYEAWRNKLDWKSTSNYCGSLFLHTVLLLLGRKKIDDVKMANEFGDAGKLLSLLAWTKLNDFERKFTMEKEIEDAFLKFKNDFCNLVAGEVVK